MVLFFWMDQVAPPSVEERKGTKTESKVKPQTRKLPNPPPPSKKINNKKNTLDPSLCFEPPIKIIVWMKIKSQGTISIKKIPNWILGLEFGFVFRPIFFFVSIPRPLTFSTVDIQHTLTTALRLLDTYYWPFIFRHKLQNRLDGIPIDRVYCMCLYVLINGALKFKCDRGYILLE